MLSTINQKEIAKVSGGVIAKQVVCSCKSDDNSVSTKTLISMYGDECQHKCCSGNPDASYSSYLLREVLTISNEPDWQSCESYDESFHLWLHKQPMA